MPRLGIVAMAIFLHSAVFFPIQQVRATPEDDDGARIYSEDLAHSWNRLYRAMLLRTIPTRQTADYASDGSSLMEYRTMGFPDGLYITEKISTATEVGDRAIEPLYPTTIPRIGLRQALGDRQYEPFKDALQAVLIERESHSNVARALMQADLWGAYDFLVQTQTWTGSNLGIEVSRAAKVLPLLAQAIKKIALSRTQIDGLPDNLSLAMQSQPIPTLFDEGNGWLELSVDYPRGHEREMDFRRVARVFIQTEQEVSASHATLEDLRAWDIGRGEITAAALILQNLLIATDGTVVPSPITYDVQVREFARDADGRVISSVLKQFELSRQLMLRRPESGGLRPITEDVVVYLPFSGNDFGFATPHKPGGAIRSTLRQKCGVCHGVPKTDVFFSLHVPPLGNLHSRWQSEFSTTRAEIVAYQKSSDATFLRLRREGWSAGAH